jgi:uncharacterized protein
MSGSLHTWYSLRDLEAFGVRQVVLSGDLEIGRLTRLAGLLHSDTGSVKATLRFRQRRDGWLSIELEYETAVELECQRCLEPFRHEIAAKVEIALLESDSMEPHVPEGFEPVALDNGRLMPARLVEDELIVSIPLVPKHARIDDCGSLARLLTQTEKPESASEASELD